MESEYQLRLRLKEDFPYYAENSLFVRSKDKGLVPFKLNKAQQYIHERIERQRKETGKVRAIVLKGRQQGCSTYVEGRFMWRTTHERGYKTFILTHEDDASKNLFTMAKRYYEHLPQAIKPAISSSNARELAFPGLDSGYAVGTAGNKSVGRSQTNQAFHGSEVAYWPNAAEHAKGILQTIPDAAGTEVIYESTANGVGNFFHSQWKAAELGLTDFIAIFVPWFWQEEYARDAHGEFIRTDEEEGLVDAYGLTNEQLAWRRVKVAELSEGGIDGVRAFQQEYPNNASEAFQVSGGEGLIKPHVVMRARKNKANPSGPYVVGVDPSRGGDRFSLVSRCGRKMYAKESHKGEAVDSLGKAVAICKDKLDTVCPIAGKKPEMMFIDFGGGADLVDRLHELGYEKRVKAIKFGGTPLNPKRYRNKRCEMWGELGAWLSDETIDVEIPDDDILQADLCASPYERDSHDRICLWRKEKIKEKYGFSPDEGDAAALTFAEPVNTIEVDDLEFDSLWH